MKKENCPFCGHRWVRSSKESPILCPNCNSKFYSQEELAERKIKNWIILFVLIINWGKLFIVLII